MFWNANEINIIWRIDPQASAPMGNAHDVVPIKQSCGEGAVADRPRGASGHVPPAFTRPPPQPYCGQWIAPLPPRENSLRQCGYTWRCLSRRMLRVGNWRLEESWLQHRTSGPSGEEWIHMNCD